MAGYRTVVNELRNLFDNTPGNRAFRYTVQTKGRDKGVMLDERYIEGQTFFDSSNGNRVHVTVTTLRNDGYEVVNAGDDVSKDFPFRAGEFFAARDAAIRWALQVR